MELRILKIEKIIDGENVAIFPSLIQIENRNYLVDCGYEESFGELVSELSKLKIGIKDLTGVIITHDDHDHMGGLKLLKQQNKNLKIYCGELERDSVSGIIKSERLIQAESSLETIPKEYESWALNFIQKLKQVQRFEVDYTFTDNEVFEDELWVVHTPGHTKGHISLYYPKEKILIAGDLLVVENGKFNIANPDFTLDMKEVLNSIEKIAKLDPQKIICYHGGIVENEISEQLKKLIHNYKNYKQ